MIMHYDSVIVTLILVVDSASLYLCWKMLQERQRSRIKRVVTKFLKSLRVRSHA